MTVPAKLKGRRFSGHQRQGLKHKKRVTGEAGTIPAKMCMSSQRCHNAEGGTNGSGDVLYVQGSLAGSLKLSPQFFSCGPLTWYFLRVWRREVTLAPKPIAAFRQR